MNALTERAHAIFPGSQVVSCESYDLAKSRMLNWIRSLKDHLEPVARWALACEGATDALALPEPHGRWARQLLDTDLAEVLAKLHKAGMAANLPSTDPTTWQPPLPRYNISHDMGDMQRRLFLSSLLTD